MFRTTFIGITGSVGKSTCKEAIGAVLASRFPTVRTIGNGNHYKGVTFTILRVRPWHKYAVVEIELDGPGQMVDFARVLRPDIVVFVNVARAHTKGFRNLDTTTREKAKLVEALRPGGIALLNDDNPYIARYQPPSHVQVVRYGASERSRFRASGITGDWPDRLSFHVAVGDEQAEIKTSLVGRHWVPASYPR